MWKLFILALFVAATLRGTEATCNVCSSSGIACISRNEFKVCLDGQPIQTTTYKCPLATQICTNRAAGCMDDNGVPLGCGDLTSCGACPSGVGMGYACTSRTTFATCDSGVLVNETINCGVSELCDVSKTKNGEYPCTDSCAISSMTLCDKNAPNGGSTTTTPTITTPTTTTPTTTTPTTTTPTTTTPTTTTPTTTTPTTTTPTTTTPTTTTPTTTTPTIITTTQSPQDRANSICSAQSAAGRYPYPNDTKCTGYVNCYWQSTILIGAPLTCPAGKYFNKDITVRACQTIKPSGCI